MALAEKVVIAMKIQQLCMAYVTVSPSVRSHTGMDDFNTIGMGLIQTVVVDGIAKCNPM